MLIWHLLEDLFVVLQCVVRIRSTVVGTGIDVNGDVGKLRHGVEHRVAHAFGNCMALAKGKITINGDLRLGVDAMPNPARAYSSHGLDSLSGAGSLDGLLEKFRLHGVHHPKPHLSGRVLQDQQDGHGNAQSHQRISQREA